MSAKINLTYIAVLFLVVLLSCFFHEFAHWLAGELLGNRMSMTLNGARPISGSYIADWHAEIITTAGPAFTILQAIVFFFIADRTKNIKLYPVLFFPFLYRFAAGVANMASPNDEGRISLHFNLGLYTLSVIVSGFLLFLIVRFSIKNKIGWRFNLITYLLCVVALSAVVLFDQYFKWKVIG
jgi:hypothetical protein